MKGIRKDRLDKFTVDPKGIEFIPPRRDKDGNNIVLKEMEEQEDKDK